MTTEDRDLIDIYVRAIAEGDNRAFDNLYNMVKKRLYYVALHFHRNKEDAEEIVDDVFRLLIKKAPLFVYFRNCYGWLVRATIRKAQNLSRKLGKRNEILETIPVTAYVKFDESKAHVFIEISKMPTPELKNLIFYRYYCKLQIGELVILFKKSRATIYRDLEVAHEILKEKLK